MKKSVPLVIIKKEHEVTFREESTLPSRGHFLTLDLVYRIQNGKKKISYRGEVFRVKDDSSISLFVVEKSTKKEMFEEVGRQILKMYGEGNEGETTSELVVLPDPSITQLGGSEIPPKNLTKLGPSRHSVR